jgi:hypothetical protein
LAKANVDAILVGEALVTSEDIPAKVRELSGARVVPSTPRERAFRGEEKSMTKIKICGIKTVTMPSPPWTQAQT